MLSTAVLSLVTDTATSGLKAILEGGVFHILGPESKHLPSLIPSPPYLSLLFNFRTFKYTTEPPVHSPKVATQLSGKSILSTPTAR